MAARKPVSKKWRVSELSGRIFRRNVIHRLERAVRLVFRNNRDGFIAPGFSAIGDDLHIKRAEQFGQPLANRAETDNQNRFPPSASKRRHEARARRPLPLAARLSRARGRFLAWASMKLKTWTAHASLKTLALLDTAILRSATSERKRGLS